MTDALATFADLRRELGRQLEHWRLAAQRLGELDGIAPEHAWLALEHYLGVALRETLGEMLGRVRRFAGEVASRLQSASTADDLVGVRRAIMELRRRYLRAETAFDFYADALATRASPRIAALLRACDHVATRSMAEALTPMGRQVPAALTYLDAGLGASILKAGLRLWDGTAESPVATIKVTRHNLLRPTSVIHEAGHQVAHMLGWNDELSIGLRRALRGEPSFVADAVAGWASEIAADAFAFVHTGYASVAALHDVVDGGPGKVFAVLPYDPHPPGYLRVKLGIAFCRTAYGSGLWDGLEAAWDRQYPLRAAPQAARELLERCAALLPRVASAIVQDPYRAFGGKPIGSLVNPHRVSPEALAELERRAGPAAFESPYWIWNESIRLLAMTGYRAAQGALPLREAMQQQERWMLTLGGTRRAA
jgi:hypothetical protein